MSATTAAMAASLVLLAFAVVLLAFRLDEARNGTVRRRRAPRTAPARGVGHRRAWLLTVLPLLLALAVGWWAWPDEAADPPAEAAPSTAAAGGDHGEASHGAAAAGVGAADLPADPLQAPDDTDPAGVAVAQSSELYPAGSTANVVLSRREPSVDALAAGGLQGLLDGPLLLTDSQALTPETAAEIDRLGQPSVHILGGPAAVSLTIQEQLAAAGHNVHRHAGPTGMHTAIDIASRHFPDVTAAVLAPVFASSLDTSDVLARSFLAGALAAARQLPVLLTESQQLSAPTADYLAESDIDAVLVVGSADQISSAVMQQLADLGVSATRLGGEQDVFAAAAAVSRAEGFAAETGEDVLLLAEGARSSMWPGISIAGAYAGREKAPLLLSDGNTLPAATRTQLEQRRGNVQRLVCLHGVSPTACAQARSLLGLPEPA